MLGEHCETKYASNYPRDNSAESSWKKYSVAKKDCKSRMQSLWSTACSTCWSVFVQNTMDFPLPLWNLQLNLVAVIQVRRGKAATTPCIQLQLVRCFTVDSQTWKCKWISLVDALDLRPHWLQASLSNTWLGPPTSSSSRLSNPLFSPVSGSDLWPLQFQAPKPLTPSTGNLVFTSNHSPMQGTCIPASPVVQEHCDAWFPVQVLALRHPHKHRHTG